MSLKITLLGYGKMGREVEKLALQRGHKIFLKIDSDDDWANLENLFPQTDVAIEFSMPEAAVRNIARCFRHHVPVVTGTTGWYDKLDEMKELCIKNSGAMVYAPNFSIGVNIFFEVNKLLAKLMNNHTEYDVWMEEVHHIHKKDSPSGTAIMLANDIINHISRKKKWENNLGGDSGELGIKSIRLEEVPGTHTVTYESDADIIEIKHTAKNRRGLAFGAITAAEWIIGKKGAYTIKDIMGIK